MGLNLPVSEKDFQHQNWARTTIQCQAVCYGPSALRGTSYLVHVLRGSLRSYFRANRTQGKLPLLAALAVQGISVIERKRGIYKGRNKSSAYKDLVWTVATSSDTSLDIEGQTKLALDAIQENLIELGSDKTKIVSAQVFIADMNANPKMDHVWCEWFGGNTEHWPQRACLGVDLEGEVLIEITVTAIRA